MQVHPPLLGGLRHLPTHGHGPGVSCGHCLAGGGGYTSVHFDDETF